MRSWRLKTLLVLALVGLVAAGVAFKDHAEAKPATPPANSSSYLDGFDAGSQQYDSCDVANTSCAGTAGEIVANSAADLESATCTVDEAKGDGFYAAGPNVDVAAWLRGCGAGFATAERGRRWVG